MGLRLGVRVLWLVAMLEALGIAARLFE
jgi:hypothetical protein